jgi:hypothetical protein
MTSRRSAPRARLAFLALAAVAAVAALPGCSPSSQSASRPAAPPKVLTVPHLSNLVEMGTPVGVLLGQIQESGTVYRLTDQQDKDLRANGFPVSILSFIQLTYTHALQQNPDLGRSDKEWHEIDGYWYGGRPFGWPEAWIVGAPPIGSKVR